MGVMKRLMRSAAGQASLAFGAAQYLRLVRHLNRWNVEIPPSVAALKAEGQPFIACFWHGRLAVMRAAWRDRPRRFHMLISGHRDGVLIARAMGHLGFPVISGSSRRGGATALRAMRQALEAGHCVGVTPDGPRGPRMRAKLGALKAAQAAGVPIVPVTGSLSRGGPIGSWDRFLVAGLFGRGVILFGEPLTVPSGAGRDQLEALRLELERRLNELTARADRRAGQPPVEPADPKVVPKGKTVEDGLGGQDAPPDEQPEAQAEPRAEKQADAEAAAPPEPTKRAGHARP